MYMPEVTLMMLATAEPLLLMLYQDASKCPWAQEGLVNMHQC